MLACGASHVLTHLTLVKSIRNAFILTISQTRKLRQGGKEAAQVCRLGSELGLQTLPFTTPHSGTLTAWDRSGTPGQSCDSAASAQRPPRAEPPAKVRAIRITVPTMPSSQPPDNLQCQGGLEN